MDLKKEKHGFFYSIAEVLLPRFPQLKKKLKLASMQKSPAEFLETVVRSTLLLSIALILLSSLLLYSAEISLMFEIPIAILILLVVFFYLMIYPDARIVRRKRELDYEIVFAGRHIVIALKSGMPLFDTLVGASEGYGEVSVEFKKIVDRIILGVPTTQAIREVALDNPSKYFVRMTMQIANSVASGADVGNSLESVLDQISKEQTIQLKEYSQKLTPFVMFYMLFGIIVPSIGVVFATALLSVIRPGSFPVTSTILIPVFLLIMILQFLFLGLIENSRPKYLI